MSALGNILWFILVGLWAFIVLSICGLLWCVTIVGIPVGVQSFKIAKIVLMPFGAQIV